MAVKQGPVDSSHVHIGHRRHLGDGRGDIRIGAGQRADNVAALGIQRVDVKLIGSGDFSQTRAQTQMLLTELLLCGSRRGDHHGRSGKAGKRKHDRASPDSLAQRGVKRKNSCHSWPSLGFPSSRECPRGFRPTAPLFAVPSAAHEPVHHRNCDRTFGRAGQARQAADHCERYDHARCGPISSTTPLRAMSARLAMAMNNPVSTTPGMARRAASSCGASGIAPRRQSTIQ
jgi:hypothetical protein